MSVLVVGISHNSAPVPVLEQVARDSEGTLKLIRDVADRMVACGITSILNFAPSVLSVPEQVDVRKVDLSIELQILAYHEQRKTQGAAS